MHYLITLRGEAGAALLKLSGGPAGYTAKRRDFGAGEGELWLLTEEGPTPLAEARGPVLGAALMAGGRCIASGAVQGAKIDLARERVRLRIRAQAAAERSAREGQPPMPAMAELPEPEPEPVSAAVAEPEPEPVLVEAPEPEAEPVLAEVAEPEAEPVLAAPMEEPEPQPEPEPRNGRLVPFRPSIWIEDCRDVGEAIEECRMPAEEPEPVTRQEAEHAPMMEREARRSAELGPEISGQEPGPPSEALLAILARAERVFPAHGDDAPPTGDFPPGPAAGFVADIPNPFPRAFPGAQFRRVHRGEGWHLEGELTRGGRVFQITAIPGEYQAHPPYAIQGFTRYIKAHEGGYWVRIAERGR